MNWKKKPVAPREPGKVLEFPDLEYRLRCADCHCRAFSVILGSNDPHDVEIVECLECGTLHNTKPEEEIKSSVLKEV